MLNMFASIVVAQSSPATPPLTPAYIIKEQPVRSLPGQLDKIPVFNSNSPEVIKNPGILLSTIQSPNAGNPQAHLNYTFNGRFDIFTHHIARPVNPKESLNLGIVVYNPGNQSVQLDVLQSLSYTTKDDAPFQELPAYADNPNGAVYSGPGSRLATDILRGISDPTSSITIAPGQMQVIFNRPIPNGSARSGLMRLRSSGGLQVASMALANIAIPPAPSLAHTPGDAKYTFTTKAPIKAVKYRSPNADEWLAATTSQQLAIPRDVAPSPPGRWGELIYGRVAGVSIGTRWEANITDRPGATILSIPARGQGISYVLNGVFGGTLGTGQIQTARLAARYPDTAFEAHGNYTTYYRLTLPLTNKTGTEQAVQIKIETPLKDDLTSDTLRFNEVLSSQVFFRGTLRLSYPKEDGSLVVNQVHVVQRRGEQGKPLVTFRILPGEQKLLEIDLIYPPDATPPQVISIESTDPATAPQTPSEIILPLVPVTTP
jgi:Protein of unknown function (DUF3370)